MTSVCCAQRMSMFCVDRTVQGVWAVEIVGVLFLVIGLALKLELVRPKQCFLTRPLACPHLGRVGQRA